MKGSTIVIVCVVIAVGFGWAGAATAGIPSRCAEECREYLDSCLDYCDQHPGQLLCRDICFQDYSFCLVSPSCTPPVGIAHLDTAAQLASTVSSGCEVLHALDLAAEPGSVKARTTPAP